MVWIERPAPVIAAQLAQLTSPSHTLLHFYFPYCRGSLFFDAVVLASASSFIKTLLDAGFAETEPQSSGNGSARFKGVAGNGIEAGHEELDFPDDPDLIGEQLEITPADPKSIAALQCHTITITQHAFKTVRALLSYLLTGRINFSDANTSTTISTWPESMYRLCHFLEIPHLRQKALEVYISQVDKSNVIAELFGPMSQSFEQIRRENLLRATLWWAEIRKSKEVKLVMDGLEDPRNAWKGAIFAQIAVRALGEVSPEELTPVAPPSTSKKTKTKVRVQAE